MQTARRLSAENVLKAYTGLSARAGITRIANITGLDSVGLPVFLAIRPTAKSLTVSIGKSPDPVVARASALMESLETWHAENLSLPTRTLPWLPGDRIRAIDPRLLPAPLYDVPSCDDAPPAAWVEGEELFTGDRTWVPEPVVSMDFTKNCETVPVARNSNGLASGATEDQAVTHALCEVIERDAEWRWRTSDHSGRVDLRSIAHPAWPALFAMLDRAGLEVAVWDVTSPVGIPCFGAVVLPSDDSALWRPTGVHDGFACHPDPWRALESAVCEAVQKRLTYIAGSRDDLSREDFIRAADPELVETVRRELAAEPSEVDFDVIPSLTAGSFAGEREMVSEHLRAAGYEQAVKVDLTVEEYGAPVVKVIVPGMYGPFGSCARPAAFHAFESVGI
ncbi:YcaO-like family protein [Streptomyces cucumeris]|uniref:YcaO-like family protein n=1 Tax=Streptomyces cucumeris TaxID=2962890 RepID=UPI0020C840FF|nr:YcaO-like family protein [Streptomyces sp. NEAU-Y11]MCP9211176.1 YcaO-like family protein [Streptomyces sp. NEAU-Y11]